MQNISKYRQSGFTLVEIAIVLVIIGLLIGGVLKGRELITNAKIKRVENDYNGISASIYAYQDRYGVLPGDDPAASTRFAGTWGATDDGDGDGDIEGGWDATTNNSESRMMWKHLRGAGLVAGPVDNTDLSYQQPTSSFGGIVGVDVDLYGLIGANIVFGQIPGDIAAILDGRGDDGNPSVGIVRGHATDTTYALDTAYDVAFKQ